MAISAKVFHDHVAVVTPCATCGSHVEIKIPLPEFNENCRRGKAQAYEHRKNYCSVCEDKEANDEQ